MVCEGYSITEYTHSVSSWAKGEARSRRIPSFCYTLWNIGKKNLENNNKSFREQIFTPCFLDKPKHTKNGENAKEKINISPVIKTKKSNALQKMAIWQANVH